MPINVPKLIQYWKQGAEEDIDTAQLLFKNRKRREALFWAHLALEKALKASVVKAIAASAPYSHDLPYLAKCAKLELSEDRRKFLGRMNQFVAWGRYPDQVNPLPSLEKTRQNIQEAEELIQWLIQRL